MKKVLHLITRLIAGGADENTIYTVEGLDRSLYDVELVVGKENEGNVLNELKKTSVYILTHLIREIHPVKDLLVLLQLYLFFRRGKYEIIHTHTAKVGILGRISARVAKVPIIVHTLHGITFHDSISQFSAAFYKILDRIGAKFTTKLITVGEDLRIRYIKAGVGREEQYVTIRSGFDLSRFLCDDDQIYQNNSAIRQQLGLSMDDILIGSASRLEARKGHQYFINVAYDICKNKSNIHFIIAGDGILESELKDKVKQYSLEKFVHFLGHRKDIDKVLCAFDLFVLTSLWEGLPRVLVQAAALKRPIITFAVEGAHEIVKNGMNGYVVNIRDVESLKRRINQLISNPSIMKKMGEKSRAVITADWEKHVMVQKISDLYQQLLAREHF